jgi:hypothetical protein
MLLGKRKIQAQRKTHDRENAQWFVKRKEKLCQFQWQCSRMVNPSICAQGPRCFKIPRRKRCRKAENYRLDRSVRCLGPREPSRPVVSRWALRWRGASAAGTRASSAAARDDRGLLVRPFDPADNSRTYGIRSLFAQQSKSYSRNNRAR